MGGYRFNGRDESEMYGTQKKPSMEMISFIIVICLGFLLLLFFLIRRYLQSQQPSPEQSVQRRRLSLDSSVLAFAPQQFKSV